MEEYMKLQITRGDVFVSKLLIGEIIKDNLPNTAVRYHGLMEPIDQQRFLRFIRSPAARQLSDCLDLPFIPLY